jgi:sugar/nucleoside kinase (ribokinase family)
VPALECDATDTTGAGDVYAAGFMAGLLLKQPIRTCADLGTRLACQSVTGYGRQRYPTRRDLEEVLDARI